MKDPLTPPGSNSRRGTRHASTVSSAQMPERRIASPHGPWLAILSKGGACCAMTSCSLTRGSRARLAPPRQPIRAD